MRRGRMIGRENCEDVFNDGLFESLKFRARAWKHRELA